jgi:bifunctional UDP-N-acetylglucosamine pyrophosphorylase/glucosamine-1-phosphate N-acetyltransferase
MTTNLACIILAAGQGKRMKSTLPKVLHKIAGKEMILHVIKLAKDAGAQTIIPVIAPSQEAVKNAVMPHEVAIQEVARGTGDAVKMALPNLGDYQGPVLILLGDMPLLLPQTIERLVAAQKQHAMAILGVEFFDAPPAFGRLVMNDDGTLARIVEDKDATQQEKEIRICNTGAFCIDADILRRYVPMIDNKNAQGEFYITDLPALVAQDGHKTNVVVAPFSQEMLGVNSRVDLAKAERAAQDRYRVSAMESGVTLIDPESVYFSEDTIIASDVVIEPHVVLGRGVVIEANVTIRAFSHLEECHIKTGAEIGPFARLRPGAHIGPHVKIGNFVEIKNATLHEGAKANHHAYIGDAEIGAHVNMGCGVITVNYDGQQKQKTIVKDGAFVGSNVNLVAPVTIGAGAYVAAGSTITKDVPEDALAVARVKPTLFAGWAAERRQKGKK